MACRESGQKWAKCVVTETSAVFLLGATRSHFRPLIHQALTTLVITPFVSVETEAQKKVESSACFSLYMLPVVLTLVFICLE